MRKCLILFVLLSSIAATSFAQFSIDTEQAAKYLKLKAEQEEQARVQDSIRKAQLEEKRLMASDIRYKLHWGNIVTYRQSVGFMENSYNLSYYGYFITKDVWTFPISLKLSSSKSYNVSYMNPGYKDWSEHLTNLGMSGFRKLKDDFYILLGGYVPLGWERYRLTDPSASDKKYTHLLLGVDTEERLLYISPDKVGLVLGFGFYQRLISSKVYTFDTGFSLDVGIKF
jgi:hypothetical protein